MSAATPHSVSGWRGAAPVNRPSSTGRFRSTPTTAGREEETHAMQRSPSSTSRLHQDEIQFRIILAATYPFFLIAAVLQRIGPTTVPQISTHRRSVFGEAKAMAVSAIPFAFMG